VHSLPGCSRCLCIGGGKGHEDTSFKKGEFDCKPKSMASSTRGCDNINVHVPPPLSKVWPGGGLEKLAASRGGVPAAKQSSVSNSLGGAFARYEAQHTYPLPLVVDRFIASLTWGCPKCFVDKGGVRKKVQGRVFLDMGVL
jgi:hypothetical protein